MKRFVSFLLFIALSTLTLYGQGRAIASAARTRRARIAALSLVYPEADPRTIEQLRELRRLLPPEVAIVVGGRAAASYADVARELGIRVLANSRQLGALLATYRPASAV